MAASDELNLWKVMPQLAGQSEKNKSKPRFVPHMIADIRFTEVGLGIELQYLKGTDRTSSVLLSLVKCQVSIFAVE